MGTRLYEVCFKSAPIWSVDWVCPLKNTTARGELSELEIALALTRAGMNVLRPMSAGLRYDLAIDNGDGTIVRVQCKTGILRDGAIFFRTYNADGRRPRGVSYAGQVEAFGVYCPQTNGAYLVPLHALETNGTARLRIGAPRNGQAKGIKYAAEFEIATRQLGLGVNASGDQHQR